MPKKTPISRQSSKPQRDVIKCRQPRLRRLSDASSNTSSACPAWAEIGPAHGLFVLGMDKSDAEGFAAAISDAKHSVFKCKICQNLTDAEVCSVCADSGGTPQQSAWSPSPPTLPPSSAPRIPRALPCAPASSPAKSGLPDDLTIRELVIRVGENDIKRSSWPPTRTPPARPPPCTSQNF